MRGPAARSYIVNLPPFQALLDEHRADVYRFCAASAGPGEADDCFQETWIAALRAYPKLRRGDNLRAWLFRIAQNKAIDLHRSRSRRAVPVEEVAELAAAGGAARTTAIPNCGPPCARCRPSSARPCSAEACSACPTPSSPICWSRPRMPPGATCSKA